MKLANTSIYPISKQTVRGKCFLNFTVAIADIAIDHFKTTSCSERTTGNGNARLDRLTGSEIDDDVQKKDGV